MSRRLESWVWWVGVVALTLVAGVMAHTWRSDHGLVTTSEATYVERVLASAKAGPGALDKAELNPLARELTAMLLDQTEASEVVNRTTSLDAFAAALLVALLLLLLRPWAPWWMAFAAVSTWILLPQSMGALAVGGPGFVSALFLLGPAMLLAIGLRSQLWSLRTIVAGVAGIGGGLGILAHPLGLWVALSLILSLFLARPRPGTEPGWVGLPALGVEAVGLVLGLACGFLAAKGIVQAKGQGLLTFFFGYMDGPHPPFAFLGDIYRGGEMGGPPWYTTVWLFLVRTPPTVLLIGGLAGSLVLRRWKERTQLADAWPLWGVALVLLVASTLTGSPMVPAGLNLLVPLSLSWIALGAWGANQAWTELDQDPKSWRLTGKVLLVVLLCAGPVFGLMASVQQDPMPQAYANALGGGTGAFLEQGNDPLAEMAIPVSIIDRLAEEKSKELVVSPWSKTAQRLLQITESGATLKSREGGPLPLLQVYLPSSPRTELMRGLRLNQTPEWTQEVAGVTLWSYYAP